MKHKKPWLVAVIAAGMSTLSATVHLTQACADQPPGPVITFHADSAGELDLNETTRLNIEKLLALYTPAKRTAVLHETSLSLPPAANRSLTRLVEQYQEYQKAVRAEFPPGRAPASAAEGLAIVDRTHALRVQFFNATVTDALFGAEEQQQRELLMLMAQDRDPTLSMEEKADRAQATHQRLQRDMQDAVRR